MAVKLSQEVQEVVEDRGPFLEMVPVIDISYLDAGYITDLLNQMEYDVMEQYIPWNTGWHDFNNMTILNKYLRDKVKVPPNTKILLKLYNTL